MYLSLCIPTNGIMEWVFPVLDSIYCQGCNLNEYEVIVTDNGDNQAFFDEMIKYQDKYPNLIYRKTNAKLFLNEIEAYKIANGNFIKFINHRTILLPDSLSYLINFVKSNIEKKPVVYFSNGMLNNKKEIIDCSSFDEFLIALNYWSSWSTGMAFWKDDFIRIDTSQPFNELFPHTNILFSETNRSEYIIDNTTLLFEINSTTTKKGHYDLFFAFAVEYPAIICDLLRARKITALTFKRVKKSALECVTALYWRFIVKKEPCSYDLSSFKSSIDVFYNKKQIYRVLFVRAIRKLFRIKKH